RDVLFPAGTVLLVSFAATNLDPTHCPWCDELRFEPEAVPHQSFGAGVHHCLEAWLALAQLQQALQVLTRELPDLRLAGEGEWRPSRSSFVGPTVLPLAFTPRSAGCGGAPAGVLSTPHGRLASYLRHSGVVQWQNVSLPS